MIICLAVGIANIFTTHPLLIIFCALALQVTTLLSLQY